MKVLQINAVCGVGSTGRIVTDIANSLNLQGHDTLICFSRGEAEQWDHIYRVNSKFDMRLHGLKVRLFDKCGFGSKGATRRLCEKITEYNPDVIHLHNIHGYFINLKYLFRFLKQYNKPIVWTFHDCWAFTGHCAYFDLVGCDKWKTGCFKCANKKEYPRSILFDRSKKNYLEKKKYFSGVRNMTIVTPSQWLANLVKQSFLKEYSVLVINNGIDISAFKQTQSNFRQKYSLENKKIVLGVASEWTRRKGLADFVKLSGLLSDEYRIVLVGLSDKQFKRIPQNILGIKRLVLSVQELAGLYSTADVFVNPTYEDNFPTTNLEAQACGTNVITYKTGGSVESVCIDNVCEQGNIEMLYEMIKRESKKKKQPVIDAKGLDKENMMREYLTLYDNLIAKK